MTTLKQQQDSQQFANEYQLVNGVAMHTQNPQNFHVPPDVIKRHVRPGQFVELRIDSPRFSVHEDTAEKCNCPSCNGELTKPILRHDQAHHPVADATGISSAAPGLEQQHLRFRPEAEKSLPLASPAFPVPPPGLEQ